MSQEIEDLRLLITDKVSSKTDPNTISPTDVGEVFDKVVDLLESLQNQNYFPTWESSVTYPIGGRVTHNGSFFRSRVDNNLNNNPITDTARWESIGDVLTKSITTQLGPGGQVGGVSTGDILNPGSSFQEVMERILQKVVPPTYLPPTVLLSPSGTIPVKEVGDTHLLNLTSVFTQNDAGSKSSESIMKNGVSVSTLGTHTETLTLTDTVTQFRSSVNYLQGSCKVNNIGDTDCNGRIVSGVVLSNIISLQGQRRMFWGFTSNIPDTSSEVRALGNSRLGNLVKGTQVNITIPVGAQSVIFAVRADLGQVQSVKYVELSNSEVLPNFTRTQLSVEGLNGASSIPYNLYVYIPVEPFNISVNYLVTI